jgi:hypothetical protein
MNGFEIKDVPIEKIKEAPDQPRLETADRESIDSLAASIKEVGLLQLIMVRPIADGFYEIVHGNRRFLACKKVGMKSLECRVKELTRDEARAIAAQENYQHKDLTPLEKGRSVHNDMVAGMVRDGMPTDDRSFKDRAIRRKYLELAANIQKINIDVVSSWLILWERVPAKYRGRIASGRGKKQAKLHLLSMNRAIRLATIGEKLDEPDGVERVYAWEYDNPLQMPTDSLVSISRRLRDIPHPAFKDFLQIVDDMKTHVKFEVLLDQESHTKLKNAAIGQGKAVRALAGEILRKELLTVASA